MKRIILICVLSFSHLRLPAKRIMISLLFCSNMEKGKVKRQKVVKRKGAFTDFEEDLIKDLFERFVSFHSHSRAMFDL